jgi:hypothetical protein
MVYIISTNAGQFLIKVLLILGRALTNVKMDTANYVAFQLVQFSLFIDIQHRRIFMKFIGKL